MKTMNKISATLARYHDRLNNPRSQNKRAINR